MPRAKLRQHPGASGPYSPHRSGCAGASFFFSNGSQSPAQTAWRNWAHSKTWLRLREIACRDEPCGRFPPARWRRRWFGEKGTEERGISVDSECPGKRQGPQRRATLSTISKCCSRVQSRTRHDFRQAPDDRLCFNLATSLNMHLNRRPSIDHAGHFHSTICHINFQPEGCFFYSDLLSVPRSPIARSRCGAGQSALRRPARTSSKAGTRRCPGPGTARARPSAV